jgi:hypothetical protein
MVESCHVRWVPSHHGMARPQVADGGDALQVWRVAANILNKQSRTPDKGWSSSSGVWPLGRPRRRWVDNIKIYLSEIGWDGINWIDLAQDRD